MKARAAALVLTLAAAGCAALAPPPPAPPPVAAAPPPSAADQLLAYVAALGGLDEASLAEETARQRELARARPSQAAALRVAIALAAAPQSDEAELLALVEPLAADAKADAALRGMASFLQGIALERRRLKESAAAAGARSRDDRRAYESQKQRADALHEKAAALQQKLDALTNLERSLSSRQAPKR